MDRLQDKAEQSTTINARARELISTTRNNNITTTTTTTSTFQVKMKRNLVIFVIILVLFILLALVGFGIYWARTRFPARRGDASSASGEDA